MFRGWPMTLGNDRGSHSPRSTRASSANIKSHHLRRARSKANPSSFKQIPNLASSNRKNQSVKRSGSAISIALPKSLPALKRGGNYLKGIPTRRVKARRWI